MSKPAKPIDLGWAGNALWRDNVSMSTTVSTDDVAPSPPADFDAAGEGQ